MRDPEKTIGNIVDKQTVSFLGSVDEEGFPNIKAMLQPRKREGIRTFYFTTKFMPLLRRFLQLNPKLVIITQQIN